MTNPTLPGGSLQEDADNLYKVTEGIIVNKKVVVSDQQSLVADVAVAVNTGIVRVTATVDSSAGSAGTETALFTIPAQSLFLGCQAEVLVDMNGNTTQTFEVGINGNVDLYIDDTDFDPAGGVGTKAHSIGGANNDTKVVKYLAAAQDIVATWINTASASAGSTRVDAHYIILANTDIDDMETAANATLDVLEAHGLMADA